MVRLARKAFTFSGIGFQLGAVFEFHFAFFLDVEAEIFEQNHVAGFGLGAGGLDFRADAVVQELHRAAEQFWSASATGLRREFFDALAIGPAEVAHQHDGAALVERVFDRRQRGLDALGVGDGAGDFVLRHVEIHADEGAFALQFDIFNKQFGHKMFIDLIRKI